LPSVVPATQLLWLDVIDLVRQWSSSHRGHGMVMLEVAVMEIVGNGIASTGVIGLICATTRMDTTPPAARDEAQSLCVVQAPVGGAVPAAVQVTYTMRPSLAS
jgi:hypothetical protein